MIATSDIAENKADYLLKKGMEILWSRGYNATSVNDIVKAADVPKGSFYFYFKSKEDFVIKALEKYFSYHLGPINEILNDKSKSPVNRLIAFHEYRIRMLKEEMDCKMGCMACNIGSEMAEHSEKIRIAIEEKEEKILNIIVGVMEEAQKLNELDASMDVRAVAQFIEDAGKGAMVSMKEKNSSEPIDNVYKMIRTYFIR